MLPPENVDGKTDNECGNDTELTDISLGLVKEVPGTIEINTSCKVTKTKRKNIKDVKIHKPLSGCRKKVEKEKERVKTMQDEKKNFDLKTDSLVSSAKTDRLRNWKATTDNNENKELQWKTEMSDTNRQNFDKLYNACNGKMLLEIFEMLFNHEIRQHIITEPVRYAQVQQNDNSFEISEHDFKCYVGTLFLSGYHTLSQQDMYWERKNDAGVPLVYEVISKNKFKQMKKYTHLSDNTQLDKSDKYAKVRPLYDITNRSLQ